MTDTPLDYATLDAGRDCNYWALDLTLRRATERHYEASTHEWIAPRLREWGGVVGTTIAENAARIDRHGPTLHTYDRDGEIRNHVEYHPDQFENERLTYEHGVIADSFRAPPGRSETLGLTHQLLANGLLSYADPGFACPVAMTGGVAFVLEQFADDSPAPDLLEPYFEGVTSREYEDLLEGAVFLTEKQGGSDVGAIETTAEPTAESGVYELTGEKWFCSNIDAEATLTLARRPDAPAGTAGLSMFLVPHTRRDGELNDQVYRRLKDKLGTISVPTGEVVFEGAEAYLVGTPEAGFTQMTEMLNLERLHNAFASLGIVGRALLESKVQAATREAFGETIDQYPLMRRDLVEMAVDYEGAVAFAFGAAAALDRRREADPDGEAYRRAHQLMRVLVPVAKYRLGKLAVHSASEACEILGGNGYVEGFATERLLRDAQVLPIWEGTSNILSLDLLRALDREDAHEALLPSVRERLESVTHGALRDDRETAEGALADLETAMATLAGGEPRTAQYEAKRLADLTYDVVTASRLLAAAQYELDHRENGRAALVARWFLRTRFDDAPVRGLTGGDRFADEHFDAIVRYAGVDPAML